MCSYLVFILKTLISNRGRWSPLSLFRQVHLGVGKSEYNPPFSGLRCSGKVVIVARRMIPLLRGQRQAHSPSAGTAESQMPSRLSWEIGRAATLLKTLL